MCIYVYMYMLILKENGLPKQNGICRDVLQFETDALCSASKNYD